MFFIHGQSKLTLFLLWATIHILGNEIFEGFVIKGARVLEYSVDLAPPVGLLRRAKPDQERRKTPR